ncbi:MAG: glycine cleavage system aminomethyltransferase GcvT [Euryarchaeota archaeon]|nr:glycine cleavage system aminomethyltransferase GcvT [Euryarchaeota archaeon]MDE1835551.1 glycine cleavage system aminomethyltransferase GcvT [Euryarchaeota archaeon]MDE1879642.1 glycine cleavage system aminomethyltransferase GcvT [Euryarchaeota archaeon]MDE2043827.1 glycine cleavage system aminomethyltransferase GcvT [Thermoplasmata archaeon]
MSASSPATVAEATPSPILKTPLHDLHVEAGGHMVPFGGWEMPLYYTRTGILEEHKAVRERVGLFDVSHMGIVSIEGRSSAALLARRTPANALTTPSGRCRYSFFLDAEARMIDDLIFTRLDEEPEPTSFLFVPNAGTTPRVLEVLLQHRPEGCEIVRHNGSLAIIAVQGPRSRELLENTYGWDLSMKMYTGGFFTFGEKGPRHFGKGFASRLRDGKEAFISRTGYTGELGFEVFVSGTRAVEIWKQLSAKGAVPCGLGARDTLRMEKGFLLSGVDFHRDRTPLEAVMDRFLDMDHPFVGREAMEKQRQGGKYTRWSGVLVDDPSTIPRHGAPILHNGAPVATVSSGCQSPTLHRGIALAYLPPELSTTGTSLEIEVRGRRCGAKVVPLPFVPNAPSPKASAPRAGS